MRCKLSDRKPDSLIRALAAKQNGVVCRAQLLAAGISPQQIQWRLRDGRLVALHRGVYLVGAVAPEWAYSQAGLYACGEGSVLGRRSATRVWRLLPYPAQAYPWVTVSPHKRIDRPRIVVQRARLEPRDIRRRHGMAATSPPRTVLDMAGVLSDPYELEALIAEAHYRGLATEAELRDQVARNTRRPGVAVLRRILDIEGGPQRTRSKGERAMLRLLRRHGVTGFEANAITDGYEVDFLWRAESFCVELDGWDGHSSRIAFERDRLKWANLEASGITVMPITGRQVAEDGRGVISRLLSVLALRRRS